VAFDSNNPKAESDQIVGSSVWNTLKNSLSKKPVPVIIESAEAYFEAFKDTEFCLFATDRFKERSNRAVRSLNRILNALKASQLAFFRVVACGRLNQADKSSALVELKAVIIYNALRGSGGTLPAFREKMRDLAQQTGLSFMLHRPRGGPIKLIDVATSRTIKVYPSFQDAIKAYLAMVEGAGFELESLVRVLSRPKGTFMIAHIKAETVGEMLRAADFTPARFSEDFELLADKLLNDRREMGFVSPLDSGAKNLARLKIDATAMGMTWRELVLVEYLPQQTGGDRAVGQPFLIVTMKAPRNDLRENLNELAVKHRQDHILYVHREGSIELLAPYHDTLKATFTSLRAGIRAYVGTMFRLPVVEVRIVP
jgi:hypothetical protein